MITTNLFSPLYSPFILRSQRFYSAIPKPKAQPINPMFITGITDGDGNFSVSIVQSSSHKLGWVVQFSYSIVAGANPPNYEMLLNINSYFNNTGTIVYKNSGNCYILKFSNLKNCLIVKEHFLKYPLLTSKINYFHLWSKVLDIIVAKNHLNSSGLLEIVSLKSQFNDGLSSKLLDNFPSVNSFQKNVEYKPSFTKLDLDWLAGFINADGSFSLGIHDSKVHSLKKRVSPKITITQNNTSLAVLKYIRDNLGIGSVYNHDAEGLASRVMIYSREDINIFRNKFKNTQLYGAKALDYNDFCRGVDLINEKAHLTSNGLNQIIEISKNMNTRRTFTPLKKNYKSSSSYIKLVRINNEL